MTMDRLLRVSGAWNWLPAFRVVAEYESIQKAAVVLNVSASALSRTVRLLEDAVGELLFVRGPAGLTLTSAGAELLRGTRDAMRRIDDVFASSRSEQTVRVFVVGASGPVLPRLLDCALAKVVPDFIDVSYRTTAVDDEDLVPELLRGNLDVALLENTAGFEHPPELTADPIGELAFALLAPGEQTLEDTTKLVVLARMAAGHDGVAAIAASMESAERMAEAGPFLALLPPALARDTFRVVGSSPVRLPVLALYRRPLDQQPHALVQALLSSLRALVQPTRSP